MNRRHLLALPALAALAALVGGHTPYGQWVAYRRKHLLIGCHRADEPTYTLAQKVVAALDEHLPAASARVARAPDAARLASLLATDQLQTAVLGPVDAVAMAAGADGFAPYGRVPLGLLAWLDDRVLVARADLPARHAYLVAGALHGSALGRTTAPAAPAGIAWHPGSAAWRAGAPLPGEEGG